MNMAESLPGKKRNVNHPPASPVSSSYSELRGTLNSVPWSSNYAQSATEYQRYVSPSTYSQVS